MRKKNADTLYDVGADFGEKRNQYEERDAADSLGEICSANKIFVPRKRGRERERNIKRRKQKRSKRCT